MLNITRKCRENVGKYSINVKVRARWMVMCSGKALFWIGSYNPVRPYKRQLADPFSLELRQWGCMLVLF